MGRPNFMKSALGGVMTSALESNMKARSVIDTADSGAALQAGGARRELVRERVWYGTGWRVVRVLVSDAESDIHR